MRVGLLVGISGQHAGVRAGVASATLSTSSLSTPVATDGTAWAAVLTWSQPGEIGNGGRLDLYFVDGNPHSIEVRDHERFDQDSGLWVAAVGTVGALVTGESGDPITVGEIEAEINATSELASVTTADPSPLKEVDHSTMDSVSTSAAFTGGDNGI